MQKTYTMIYNDIVRNMNQSGTFVCLTEIGKIDLHWEIFYSENWASHTLKFFAPPGKFSYHRFLCIKYTPPTPKLNLVIMLHRFELAVIILFFKEFETMIGII